MSGVIKRARAQYERDGYCFAPTIIPPELIERVIPRMDAVIAGEYETSVPPHSRRWNPGDNEGTLCKIDQPHLSDGTISELIGYSEIGRWAAGITGAKYIQAWAVQLLYKPPGGEQLGNVGWHQDKQYWSYWEGEVFTAWVALSNVTEASGPMRFVQGSHKWGLRDGGDFFGSDHEAQRQAIQIPAGEAWEEIPAILPPGGVSFHHPLTLHGSGPNRSTFPRRSFAIHLRTEKSRPIAENYYVSHLDDQTVCPIIYQEK